MLSRKKGIEKFHLVLIFLLISLLVLPMLIFGEKAEGKTEGKVEDKAGFDLTIKDDLIFLNAKDTSLKKIMEEIGSKMAIEVVGNIPTEERISAEFDRLSLKDALEKLSSNYGYQMDSEKGENKIVKIIILPKGEESRTQERETTIPVKHEPFKFEFDPSKFMKEGK